MLVADAEASMGAGRPTDCASFTTSLVTCSAITVCGTVAGEDALSESGSLRWAGLAGPGEAARPCSMDMDSAQQGESEMKSPGQMLQIATEFCGPECGRGCGRGRRRSRSGGAGVTCRRRRAQDRRGAGLCRGRTPNGGRQRPDVRAGEESPECGGRVAAVMGGFRRLCTASRHMIMHLAGAALALRPFAVSGERAGGL